MTHIHWFEIPVTDMERAQGFYEAVLQVKLNVVDMREQMGSILGIFPSEEGNDGSGSGGTLVQNEQHGYVPGQAGALIYLSVGDEDLDHAVGRVDGAGGQVLLPKTSLGGNGYCAWLVDTEGNRVGLYSTQ